MKQHLIMETVRFGFPAPRPLSRQSFVRTQLRVPFNALNLAPLLESGQIVTIPYHTFLEIKRKRREVGLLGATSLPDNTLRVSERISERSAKYPR
jgi:hypothetical protein